MSDKPAKKPPPDWEQAEKLYRAGQLSLSEIGGRIGVSKQAVIKRMRKAGITRDLTPAVRQATKRKIAEQAVTDSVDGFHSKRGNAVTEREIIESNAQLGSKVVECHRRDIKAGREVCALLLGELFQTTTQLDQVEQAILEETANDDSGQRRALMKRAVSLPSRAGVVRDLTAAMKNLQGLERIAFGLTEKTDETPDYETELKRLSELEPK